MFDSSSSNAMARIVRVFLKYKIFGLKVKGERILHNQTISEGAEHKIYNATTRGNLSEYVC